MERFLANLMPPMLTKVRPSRRSLLARGDGVRRRQTIASADTPVDSVLRDGDLVFIAIFNPFYREVGKATRSWATHVGIAFRDGSDGWQVAESRIPFSCWTPLPRYLARAAQGLVAVRRLPRDLSPDEAAALREAAHLRMGRFYDIGFDLDRLNRQFCSRFVYEVFHEAVGVEIGPVKRFQDLLVEHPTPRLWPWKVFYRGRIPWHRRTVTPADQYRDPQLVTVLDTGRNIAGLDTLPRRRRMPSRGLLQVG
jgi:hypothetical protein